MLISRQLGLVVGTLLVTGTVASAQPPRPERPYRGLFRGGAGGGDQSLTLDLQVGGGYDDNVFPQEFRGGGVDTRETWQSGGFGYVGADLAYLMIKPLVSFGASLTSSNRYFSGQDQATEFLGAHSGRLGVSIDGRRTQFSLGQTVGYQPFLTLNVLPVLNDPQLGQGEPADQNQGTPLASYMNYLTAVDLTRQVSRRGALVFSYGYRLSDFTDEGRDLAVHTASGRYEHEILRDLSVRFGYGFSEGRYSTFSENDNVRNHTIDVGINFDRALSISRRTTVSFQTGGTALNDREQTHYRLLGGARLNHEMGRTWNASVAFLRNAAFLESLAEPYMSDALSVGVLGMLTDRLELMTTAGASTGTIGFADTGNDGLVTYATEVRLTLGLTRLLALGLSHTYYHYAFDSGVTLPVGLSSRLNRQSALATLNVWLPLLRSARRPNASR